MPRGVWNQEWLNQNSQRAYPLTEAAAKTDISGALALADDFILALTFPVHAGNDVQPGKFYVKEIGVFGAGFSVSIGYDDGTAAPPTVASTVFSRSGHTEYMSYALAGIGDFSDSVGQLNIGHVTAISSAGNAVYKFTPVAGALEVEAIDPMIRQVQGLVVINDGERSSRLYGDIEIEAGTNMRITVAEESGQNPKLTFNAIDGEGLSVDCVCEDDSLGPCIRTINSIPPTPQDGNFTILGDTCIEVSGITNGLQLEDKCSEPCCDCADLDALRNEVATLGSSAANVQGFVNRLQTEVVSLSDALLGSILSDDSCVSCTVSES